MSLSSLIKCSQIALFAGTLSFAQAAVPVPTQVTLDPQTTLPVSFTKALRADRLKAGDAIVAKTTQAIRLSNGQLLRSGAEVHGHVLEATSFHYDKTPYARQKQGLLSLQFDTVSTQDGDIPLHVSVRAIADRFASDPAITARPSDEDELHRTTQIGGDIVTPSQSEIVSQDGDTVGYNRRGGHFAHLIAKGRCDGSNTEQAVWIFSASACGVYGFSGMAMRTSGATVAFASTHHTPEIPKYSTALLEVQSGENTTLATRP